MNIFEFQPIYNSIIEPKRPKYIFHYCTLRALDIFPEELILVILGMEMHYMKKQLELLVDDEKLLMGFIIVLAKAFQKQNNEIYPLFHNNPTIEKYYDDITDYLIEKGKEAFMTGNYSSIITPFKYPNILIDHLRPYNTSLYDDILKVKKIMINYVGSTAANTMQQQLKNALIINQNIYTKHKHMEQLVINIEEVNEPSSNMEVESTNIIPIKLDFSDI